MRRAITIIIIGLLAGCASEQPAGPGIHDDEALALQAGARVRLRTDLPPEEAKLAAARLDALEEALDTAFPFIPAPGVPPLTIALADPARFALHAKEHQVSGPSSAFVCGAGELFALWEPHEAGDGPVALEPPLRPLAKGTLRRRLLAGLGADLPETWLEEGLAEVFVEVAGAEGEPSPRRRARERELLIDAYLPLYLGGAPALAATCAARGADEKRRSSATPALAASAVRFLLGSDGGAKLIGASLRRAAGLEDDQAWAATKAGLEALEPAFERWLGHAVREALLQQLVEPGPPVDRWEAAAALRLVANVDIDPDQDEATRLRQVEVTRELLSKEQPGRFLDGLAGQVAQAKEARSRLQAVAHLRRLAQAELDRRAKGYGHPAVEAAREGLGRAVQRLLDDGR